MSTYMHYERLVFIDGLWNGGTGGQARVPLAAHALSSMHFDLIQPLVPN